VQGELLPWRDVLHEGPVHAGLPLAELSRRRAAFIASCGWADPLAAKKQFEERDAALAAAGQHHEVVLWFEHDLYDQLQLLQLLDWFAAHPHPTLSLVCEAEYLGTMTPARAGELFRARRAVSEAQLKAGAAAWGAFGSSDPRAIRLEPVPGLPFLAPALRRLLEELPWTRDGLSRLERQILEALGGGPLPFAELFPRAHHHREDPVFVGDAVLALYLERLAADGFVDGNDRGYSLLPRGKAVLEGKADACAFARRPRWLGGYEIRSARLRWDPRKRVPTRTA
jgi:hypothetical protein